MKKFVSAFLCGIITLSTAAVFPVGAAQSETASDGSTISFDAEDALFVHGVLNSSDTEAWQRWQSSHDEDFAEEDSSVKYFFLPTSASDTEADVYNGFSETVTVCGTSIAPGETETVSYSEGETYSVNVGETAYSLIFMKSSAEVGIYVNNSDANGYGTDLMTYLNSDKSRSASATGAIVDSDGNVDNTSIKKIKGRGNTSWYKAKKGYNITYSEKVEIGGMSKSKKYSILANYQDDSLSRNRFLYDLADAVDIPYASDSRYADFYVNGFYRGSYLICEKVEAGKNNLVNDIDEDAYLNEDGTVNEDFPFLCEIDKSAGDDDCYVECSGGNKVTIKSPEIDEGDPGYEEVKAYVKEKFNALYKAARNKKTDLSDIIDLESAAKLYLINELGKNWDSGVSSTFFVWKQDEDGNYKFYASPVWDYDNSLGNAAGLEWDLSSMGVDDYTEYTGWWCKYKDKKASSKTSQNLMTCFALNESVMDTAAQVWFNDFVPALKDFFGETDNGIMKSYEDYYSLLSGSAEMNYASGWLLYTSSWIADHSSLDIAYYDEETHTMKTEGTKTYSQNFDDMFMYAVDWMYGRSAWLSEQFYPDYRIMGDVNGDGEVTVDDVTEIQKYVAGVVTFTEDRCALAEVDGDDEITIDDAAAVQKYIAGIT